MPDAFGPEADERIAKELTIAALQPGGNSSASAIYNFNQDGTAAGNFVGDMYAAVLKKVREANRAR